MKPKQKYPEENIEIKESKQIILYVPLKPRVMVDVYIDAEIVPTVAVLS